MNDLEGVITLLGKKVRLEDIANPVLRKSLKSRLNLMRFNFHGDSPGYREVNGGSKTHTDKHNDNYTESHNDHHSDETRSGESGDYGWRGGSGWSHSDYMAGIDYDGNEHHSDEYHQDHGYSESVDRGYSEHTDLYR